MKKIWFQPKVVPIFSIIALALVLGTHTPASALSISLSDGSTTVTCDDGAACDSNPTAGAVTFIGPVGTWTTNITTGLSFPALGTADFMDLDLNSVDVNTGTGGTLTLLVSQTGFTGPIIGGFVPVQFAIGGTINPPSGSVQARSWVNDNNTLFAQQDLIGSVLNFNGPAFSGVTSDSAAATAPFSGTIEVALTLAGPGNASFNAELNAIPEPSALLLVGSGILALGWLRRKRNN
jgi:hypothetical protein